MSKQTVAAPITLSQAIDGVSNSISNIFSKEDVLRLLMRIEVNVTEPEFTEDEMQELIDHVRGGLAYVDSSEVVDYDSARFEIGDGNVVELKDIDIDTDHIEDEIEESIRQWFDHNVF
jgi:Ran GTPase-activating protein (RanGAP) involved in mRNA processing and transport